MHKPNRGKDFEDKVREGFERIPNTICKRLIDAQGGYIGIANECDFLVYNYPLFYAIECKCTYDNTLSINSNQPKKHYGDISDRQWGGLLEWSSCKGVVAGVIVWFITWDETLFIPIGLLEKWRNDGHKSVNIKDIEVLLNDGAIRIKGSKKRIFWDYDFVPFFKYYQLKDDN